MESNNRRYILLALISGLAAVLIWTGLLGASTAQAQQSQSTFAQQELAIGPTGLIFTASFTDPSELSILDPSGNAVGKGTKLGEVKCNISVCNHKIDVHIDLTTDSAVLEYKFRTRQALDLESRRAVVEGTGTIGSDGMKEGFLFTATFQDNRDGTVSATYEASRPDASFMIPNAPGSFLIRSR